MTEDIEDILVNGYRTWRKNLILGVPHLLDLIASIIVLIISLILMIFIVVLPLLSQITRGRFDLSLITFPVLLLLIVLILVTVFLLLLITSFFSAGAIGMTRRAIETGKTTMSEMIDYGKKKFISLFFVNIIILLLTILGFLFFIPAVIAFLSKLINVGLSLLILSFAVWMLYLTTLEIILIFVPYAVVVSDLGAIEGIKKGYRIFMENKLSIIFLWFITLAIGWGCSLIINAITSFMGILPCIGTLINIVIWLLYFGFLVMVITPLSTVWWTRLYLDRTIGIKNEPSPPETQPPSQEPPSSQPEIYI